VDAIAILEQAVRRVPDPGLQDLLGKAKQKAQKQAVEKRREQYVKSAKDSLARGDSASAVVTLEMAQSEFTASDQEIQTLLTEARAAAERDARAAAEREKKERREAEQRAREAAQKQEIQTTVANAKAQGQQGDFTGALKLIEQCAVKFGMRAELSAAANEIKASRTANAATQIEALINLADSEAAGLHFPGALQAIERAKSLTEFASQTIVIKLKAAEKKILEASQEQQNSATVVMKSPAVAAAMTTPVHDAESLQATKLFGGGASAAAAAAPAPIKRPEPGPQPTTAQRAAASVPRQVPQPPPPSASKKLIPIVAVAVLAVVAVALYFVFSPSGVDVRFEAEPAGTVVTVDGQQCQAPCALKMKAGKHSLKATHDQYTAVEKEITVEKPYTESLKLTALASGAPSSVATAFGTLALTVSVPGADIFIDGQFKDTAKGNKARLQVAAGHHDVRINKQGYQSATQTVDVAKDAEAPLSFTLAKGVSAGPVQTYVIIKSVPNAKVVIDNQPVGTVQADGKYSGLIEPDKQHSVQLSLDGYEPASKTFTAPAGQKLSLTLSLKGIKPTVAAAPATPAAAPTTPAAVAKPIVARFELGNESIREGDKVKLFWDAQNADSVTIDPGLGQQKPSGSTTVSPSKTTTYTLTAKGPGGTVSSQPQTLTVEAKAAPTPSAPAAGASSSGPDETQAIQQVFAKYKNAWETQNVGAAKAVWPSLPKEAQNSMKMAKGLRMELDCTPKVSGTTATASCNQTVSIQGTSKTVMVMFSLSKSNGNWLIESSR
jgi:hypothetical protein